MGEKGKDRGGDVEEVEGRYLEASLFRVKVVLLP